jgi:hypothetical protein
MCEQHDDGCLTPRELFGPHLAMATPTDQNFQDYKKAEKKALELLAAMKAATPKKADIEVALLVAIFELHKGLAPAETVVGIIQGHVKALMPFYAPKGPPPN